MTDVKMNHRIITTTIDSFNAKELLSIEYVRNTQFSGLRYGWGVILCYCWLKHMLIFRSTAVLKILSSDEDLARKANKLYHIAQNTVVVQNISTPAIIGGNIVIPDGTMITAKDMLIALKLDKSQLATYLSKICGTKFGINKVCLTDLKEVISLIDFAIPSISLLFKAMGFNYLNNQPYLEDGILITSCQRYDYLLCAFYGSSFKKYKRMEPHTFAALVASGDIDKPMLRQDTLQMHVETNDIFD